MNWTTGTYNVRVFKIEARGYVLENVQGYVSSVWGIRKESDKYWVITHIPSGYFFQYMPRLKYAKALCEELASIPWSEEKDKFPHYAHIEQAKPIIHKYVKQHCC